MCCYVAMLFITVPLEAIFTSLFGALDLLLDSSLFVWTVR